MSGTTSSTLGNPNPLSRRPAALLLPQCHAGRRPGPGGEEVAGVEEEDDDDVDEMRRVTAQTLLRSPISRRMTLLQSVSMVRHWTLSTGPRS